MKAKKVLYKVGAFLLVCVLVVVFGFKKLFGIKSKPKGGENE